MIARRGTNLRFSINRKQAGLGHFVVKDREVKQKDKTKKHAHTPSDLDTVERRNCHCFGTSLIVTMERPTPIRSAWVTL
jgi:hypothetical protein